MHRPVVIPPTAVIMNMTRGLDVNFPTDGDLTHVFDVLPLSAQIIILLVGTAVTIFEIWIACICVYVTFFQ